MTPLETPHPGPDEGPDRTQKLTLPLGDDSPLKTQRIPPPTGAAEAPVGRSQVPPSRSATGGWKVPLLLGGAALLGGVAYLVFGRGAAGAPAAPQATAPETVHPGAQAYLDQARAGDAHAMRMLGVMYYYGLNVPQDREKGLHWYREAAGRGSEAARAELEKLEAAGTAGK